MRLPLAWAANGKQGAPCTGWSRFRAPGAGRQCLPRAP